jgi:hypothetical protein
MTGEVKMCCHVKENSYRKSVTVVCKGCKHDTKLTVTMAEASSPVGSGTVLTKTQGAASTAHYITATHNS